MTLGEHLRLSRQQWQDHEKEQSAITKDPKLSSQQRKRKRQQVRADPTWATNYSFWWGYNNVLFVDVRALDVVDLAVRQEYLTAVRGIIG